MRARNLKPGFFKNESLAECSYEARILFAGLWCLADREGRLENRPKRIKIEIFPFDDMTVEHVTCTIQALDTSGLVRCYAVHGVAYIDIPGFLKHQHPHARERESEIPHYENRDIGGENAMPDTSTRHVPGVSTTRPDMSTTRPDMSTTRPDMSTTRPAESCILNDESCNMNHVHSSPKRRSRRKENDFSPEAERIYGLYRDSVRVGASTDAKRWIDRRLKESIPAEELETAVRNYAADVSAREPGKRLQANNFFGEKENWRDYLQPIKQPGPEQRKYYEGPNT